jgi:molybdenum cofactor synthesis domain-containing protein
VTDSAPAGGTPRDGGDAGPHPAHGTVIIAVGDEVLGGFTLDTNSHWLAGRVREAGYPAQRIEVVADRADAIIEAVRRAVAEPRADRVLVCGGLGPTPDDRTLEAVGEALGRPIEVHADALAHVQGIVDRMHDAGWLPSAVISDANRKMTLAPQGAEILENRRGMASGILVPLPAPDAPDGDRGGSAAVRAGGVPAIARWLAILPGVPREMQAIVEEELIPRHFTGATAETVVELRYRYAIEAEFVEPMRAVEEAFPDVHVGSYPQTDRRELVVRLKGGDAERVAAAAATVRSMRPPRDDEEA